MVTEYLPEEQQVRMSPGLEMANRELSRVRWWLELGTQARCAVCGKTYLPLNEERLVCCGRQPQSGLTAAQCRNALRPGCLPSVE